MQQDSLVQEGYALLDEPLRNLERLRKNDRMLYQPLLCTATGGEFSMFMFLEIRACLSNEAQKLSSKHFITYLDHSLSVDTYSAEHKTPKH